MLRLVLVCTVLVAIAAVGPFGKTTHLVTSDVAESIVGGGGPGVKGSYSLTPGQCDAILACLTPSKACSANTSVECNPSDPSAPPTFSPPSEITKIVGNDTDCFGSGNLSLSCEATYAKHICRVKKDFCVWDANLGQCRAGTEMVTVNTMAPDRCVTTITGS
jgi:hypothetical protein